MKPKYLFLIFFCFFGFFIIRAYLASKKEDDSYYNFIITKIELTPAYRMILYYGNKKILFHNFTIMDDEDVKIGDKVVKEKNSKVLKIFRKNKDGVYEKHIEIYSTNII